MLRASGDTILPVCEAKDERPFLEADIIRKSMDADMDAATLLNFASINLSNASLGDRSSCTHAGSLCCN